jgi:hypothetical protein
MNKLFFDSPAVTAFAGMYIVFAIMGIRIDPPIGILGMMAVSIFLANLVDHIAPRFDQDAS